MKKTLFDDALNSAIAIGFMVVIIEFIIGVIHLINEAVKCSV